MTTETYKLKIKEIDKRISDLYTEKSEAREFFLKSNSEFKIGDKVKVYRRDYESKSDIFIKEAIIGRIHDKYYEGKVNYDFVAIKKDGTASEKSAGIYSFSKLELIP